MPADGREQEVIATAGGRLVVAWSETETWGTAIYDLRGVTAPPADYTAARLWDDLKADDPLTVYRAVRWAVAHSNEAIPAMKRGAEEGKPASTRPFAESKLAEMIADPEPDSPATRRSWRAVYVVERIGSPAADTLLRDWRNHLMPSSLSSQAYLSLRDRGNR